MLENIVAIVAVLVVSILAAYNRREHSFSQNTFLASLVIGIGILTWTETVPYYAIIVSVLIIAGMFLMGRGDGQ